MSKRIEIRNKIKELVETMPDFQAGNVQLYKLDNVDRTPFASVYLDRMTSDPDAMASNGDSYNVDRSLRVAVDFHLDKSTLDADADMDAWLSQLEHIIMTAAEAHELPRNMALESAQFRALETSRERKGDLVTIWRADYDEWVSA